jgi:hypothetical protein
MTKLLQKVQYWIAADPNAMVEGRDNDFWCGSGLGK